jgi:hypothetical protein
VDKAQIRWVLKSKEVEISDQTVQLPVYLNEDRSDLLFIINSSTKKEDKNKVAQRGVAVII